MKWSKLNNREKKAGKRRWESGKVGEKERENLSRV